MIMMSRGSVILMSSARDVWFGAMFGSEADRDFLFHRQAAPTQRLSIRCNYIQS